MTPHSGIKLAKWNPVHKLVKHVWFVFVFVFVYLTFFEKQSVNLFSRKLGGMSRVHSENTFWKISRQDYVDEPHKYFLAPVFVIYLELLYAYIIYYYEISNTLIVVKKWLSFNILLIFNFASHSFINVSYRDRY